jgi:hypothetical protein
VSDWKYRGRASEPKVPVQTSHTFHLLMCLLSCGAWLPIWAVIAFLNSLSRKEQTTAFH